MCDIILTMIFNQFIIEFEDSLLNGLDIQNTRDIIICHLSSVIWYNFVNFKSRIKNKKAFSDRINCGGGMPFLYLNVWV